jgi:predicted AlkP superfamily pyrophosphatase or phosphodiesterase
MKKNILFLLCTILSFSSSAMPLKTFIKKPRLVVVIVIDQFRADYLTRFHTQFKKGTGFDFLMSKGAYFPFARYDFLQSMTCPGHATISTGANPFGTGIPLNAWFDSSKRKVTYCVEDSETGPSPRNLKTTTFSDEAKLVHQKTKVVSVALKDRSAIMLGGHQADVSAWLSTEGQWQTSGFYKKGLPAWTLPLNQQLKNEKGQKYIWKSKNFEKNIPKLSPESLGSPYGLDLVMNFAETALVQEKLGKSSDTDFLMISLSHHDLAGHAYGPLADEMKELTLAEDRAIERFLQKLRRHFGSLDDVTIALTADHGVPPRVEEIQAARISAGKIDQLALHKDINQKLDADYGIPKNKEWIAASQTLNFYLNQETLKEKKIASEEIENKVRSILLLQEGTWTVFTRSDYLNGRFPPGPLGEAVKNQYVLGASGDILLIPRPYYLSKDDNATNHMTNFNYDTNVPLIVYSSKVKAGVYSSPASIVDLAPTLAFIVGTTPPASSIGKVLPIFE